ncbi:MAG TPA: TonB-dependent receptor [Bacteroidota bacterium]|nr:TonB-dependent receptor [Bacteroidota bacterium]
MTIIRAALCCLLFVVGTALTVAGTTGKIAGIVKDAQTGETLVGASVVIQGTAQGAATNVDGYYVILNLSPGKYSLVVSAVGYNKKTINDVAVSIDLTTNLDITLTSTVVQMGEEIVTTATRPMVTKDLTATTAVVSGDQIRALPVTEVSQVLNLQAGFVNGSLRGGRQGEVAYWIDGVPVSDAYDRSSLVEINKSAVQEMQAISGAFNAEYGEAMGGVVNIATKEGADKFTGSASTYFGGYLPNDKTLFPGNNKFRPTSIRDYEGSVSGPVTGNDLTFFANGRYYYGDGYLFGFNRFNPFNVAYTDSLGNYHLYRDPSGKGDSSRVPMNSSERKYGQGKLTWRLSPTMKLTGNFIYDWNKSRPYGGFNTGYRNYFYDPNGFGYDHNTSNTLIVQWNHVINDRTFYTVNGSYYWHDYRYSLYDDLNDPRYVHPNVGATYDSYSFQTGGTDLRYTHRRSTTLLGKADITSQVSETHLMKMGVEFQQYKLNYENLTLIPVLSQTSFTPATSSPFITTQIPDISTAGHDSYERKPYQLAAYIQDKMEFKDFIVNIGIRFDYFQPKANVLNDAHPNPNDPLYYTYTVDDPNIFNPLKPNNRFFDYNGNGVQDPGEPTKTVADRMAYWYRPATAKWQISPRLGFSFPITARGVVHFSYGHFFQIPRFEYLYDNPFFKVGQGTSNIISNADLGAEQTINGELGVQQQLTDDISADLTGYMRDIRNLSSTRGELLSTYGGAIQFTRYVNSDFGLVKGIVLTIQKRFSNGFQATLDYTYQVARGTNSDPAAAFNAAIGGQRPEVFLTPLDWDQRHTLNITVSYNEKDWGVSLIGRYGSGAPYTPRASTDVTSLLTNSQLKPSTLDVDLNADYEFQLDKARLVVFARAFNLFDIMNEVNVFNDSGRAGFTIDEATAIANNPHQYVNSINQWYTIPTNYSEPRRIEFGMNLEF